MVGEGYMVEEPDPEDKRYINHRLLKGLDDIIATASGIKYGKNSGNREFPISVFKNALDETIEFLNQKYGKIDLEGRGIYDALKDNIDKILTDEQARSTLQDKISIFLADHEANNMESGKSRFPQFFPHSIGKDGSIDSGESLPGNREEQKKSMVHLKVYRCKTCGAGIWRHQETAEAHKQYFPSHEIEETWVELRPETYLTLTYTPPQPKTST